MNKNLLISNRGSVIPASPIRKLIPCADEAKSRGIEVYHLNIGQPDIQTPSYFWRAIQGYGEKVLAYGPSNGLLALRKAIATYYNSFGAKNITTANVSITTGGSEAILFVYIILADKGDEFLIPDPCYANYISLAAIAEVKLVPILTKVEEGFHLPEEEEIEKLITPKTKGIIICTPNNPTGTIYSKDEMMRVARIAEKHNIYLISDEVYREFLFDGRKHTSVFNLPGEDEYKIVIDSVSKRFSACGARIGCVVSTNENILKGIMRCSMSRLCPPTIEQVGMVELYGRMDDIIPEMMKEYELRRNVVYEEIQKIPGAFATLPEGAFYMTCRLPVEDAEKFTQWMLTDFSVDGKTTMIAPGEGFYVTPGRGRNEARIAYVLKEKELRDAMRILREGIKKYQTENK
ncbi:MAG: pyridoxal phosphate-dependent aminotransferase [bacterium]